jgi:sulfite exporter TauE/SafE
MALIEHELKGRAGMHEVRASLSSRTVTVTGEFGDESPERLAEALSVPLASHGYALLREEESHAPRWSEFRVALPVAIAAATVFVGLQKLGIVNLVGEGSVTFGTAALIGVIASLSTCMAVVGGLVLSLSASLARVRAPFRAHLAFHLSRLVSFFVFGAALGLLGAVLRPNPIVTGIFSVVIALTLIAVGINLLEVFPWAKRFQITLPRGFGTVVHRLKARDGFLAPILLGAATFFLPCGFTQSMQLYALSQGDMWAAAGLMLAFAFGTLPVLFGISITSSRVGVSKQRDIFFKVAGLLVVFFGVLNLITGLAALGIVPPLISF